MTCKYHDKLHGENCLFLKGQTCNRSDHDHDRNGIEGYWYTHTTLREGMIEFACE